MSAGNFFIGRSAPVGPAEDVDPLAWRDRRCELLEVRCTPNQLDAMKKRAEAAGMSLDDYVLARCIPD